MGTPQIIILVLYVLGLGISLAEHGKVELKQESFLGDCFPQQFTCCSYGGAGSLIRIRKRGKT